MPIQIKFITIPVFIIKLMFICLVEKTIAFGGVDIGIMKAQLAAKTTGKIIFTISKPESMAKVPSKGNNKKVVAVLLVNSVKKDVRNVKNNIIKIISNLFKKLIYLEISSANPVSITKEAIANPQPKSIKTFQGISLYHSKLKIGANFLFGIIKKRNDPNIAMTGSERLS